jgi:hypothetical protein
MCGLLLTSRQFEYESPIANFTKPGLLGYVTVLTDNLLAAFPSSTTVKTSNPTAHYMLVARQQAILALILQFSEELPFNRPSQSESTCQLHRVQFYSPVHCYVQFLRNPKLTNFMFFFCTVNCNIITQYKQKKCTLSKLII